MAEEEREAPYIMRGSVPQPDPTLLTTQAQERALSQLREEIAMRVDGMRETVNSRFASMDALLSVLGERITKSFEHANENIAHLRDYHGEKFYAINTQFKERDERTAQLSTASKDALAQLSLANQTAVNAALLAQKESATESKTAFTKQIDQTQALLNSITKSLEDKINDVKSRVDQGLGTDKSNSAVWLAFLGGGGLLISLVTMIFVIIKLPH